VANHPYGLADGLLLGAIISRLRPDVKFLANSLLASVRGVEEFLIPVDLTGGEASVRKNSSALRRAAEWLNSGGVLAVFPAGEVSALKLPVGIAEPAWNGIIARLAQITGATVVPVFFHGSNSATFHVAGLLHPMLRTALLPRELFNKRGRTVEVSIGSAIPPAKLARPGRKAADYLQWRTQLLRARRTRAARPSLAFPPILPVARKTHEAIVGPRNPVVMQAEIDALPERQKLLRHSEYLVLYASAVQIPETLQEIGRLREVAFRGAGEGTGESSDLDAFDLHYLHLMVWNQERRELAGAYRIARTDTVLSKYGPQGLYTSTLFRFKSRFLSHIDPALELGRSFIRPEYQKSFLPLLLLWKGIGHYVAHVPWCKILFGPVSISNAYTSASRTLMVSFLREQHSDRMLARSVRPRHKFRTHRALGPLANCLVNDVEELSEAIADLEPDGKGVPVLLRQYLNIGGQVLDFSVDGDFSEVLDALIVVDLTKTSERLLERYMGKEGAARFRRYHATREKAPALIAD
jgi:putative hemolysin